MGFFASVWRLIRTCFGLAEGSTERATDALLVSSPETIRSQFRKTREDWRRDLKQLNDAVEELSVLRGRHYLRAQELQLQIARTTNTMHGSVKLFKETGAEQFRVAYGVAAEEHDRFTKQLETASKEIENEDVAIAKYRDQCRTLATKIADLEREESETVAEIVSSQKLAELNRKLSGLATDTQAKNLEAIRDAREKAKVRAAIAIESAKPTPHEELSAAIEKAGSQSKHLEAFDRAVGIDRLFVVKGEESKALPPKMSVNDLFKETSDDRTRKPSRP